MLSIPKRLLELDTVTPWMQAPHGCVLRKWMDQTARNRQSYLSQHTLTWVQAGEQLILPQQGSRLSVGAGQWALLPRGMYTISDLVAGPEGFETILFFFDEHLVQQCLAEYPKQAPRAQQPIMHPQAPHPAMQHYLQQLMQQKELIPPSGPLVHAKLLELLHLVMASTAGTDFLDLLTFCQAPPTQNLVQFLEAHYDKPMKVEDYAYLTGRSMSSFRRDFKRHFETTPQQWLVQRRMARAAELLAQRGSAVAEVSQAVGYESTSHFIEAFKKVHRMTPKAYAQQAVA